MPTQLTYETIKYVPDCQQATMQQVLEILERWRMRTEDHFSNNRRDHRFPYPNRALIVCQERLSDDEGAPLTPVALEVQTRNLSCGGVSVLTPAVYVSQNYGDHSPPLSADHLLPIGREVSIGLPRSQNEYLWMRGTVVRSRIVHFGFRECGISFLARHQDQGADSPSGGPART